MSTDWGSATDAKGARISLLHDDTSSQQADRTSATSSTSNCRQHSAALPPISPLLNVSYPGTAQTTIKRALNITTADPPYYPQPTSGSSVSSPQATTPEFSEYNSAPASTYSPSHIHSALDPSLTSSSSYIRDRPTFSRPGSFSLPRDSVPRDSVPRYPPVTNERLYGSQGQLGYSASPPSMSDRSYQSYMRRGDDLRRSDSYGTTSSGSANSSMDSEGPFTPLDEMPSWGGRYRLYSSSASADGVAYPSLLGKRSRDERDGEYAGGYQYPPPPTGPEEETRYEERYEDPYTREYKPRTSPYNYPPPPAPYRELSYAAPPLAPSYHSTSSSSSRYSPIRTQPTHSSSLRQSIAPPSSSTPTNPPSSSVSTTTAPKKFPCRFLHVPPIYCTQTFTTSGHASRHAKIHKEEKGISCVYPGCGKRFTRGDNMKQHLETHFRVRGSRKKGALAGSGKREGSSLRSGEKGGLASSQEEEDGESRKEMQRLLREGAEKRERERGVREGRRREREEMDMSMSVSPRTVRGGRLEGEGKREVPYYIAPQMDALDALATVAVGRK